jgi:hypothetical protein
MTVTARVARITVALLVILSCVATASGAETLPAKQVGTDPSGDVGDYSGGPNGTSVVGMDLVRASIGPGENDTLDFILDVTQLPPVDQGGTASIVYEWYFTVGDRVFGMYGPCFGHIYGLCESQTDPLAFIVRDGSSAPDCMSVELPGTTCPSSMIGTARLTNSQGAGQITFPIPRSFLGAGKGDLIKPVPAGLHDDEAAVVAHTFYFSNAPAGSPRDVLDVTKRYRVP